MKGCDCVCVVYGHSCPPCLKCYAPVIEYSNVRSAYALKDCPICCGTGRRLGRNPGGTSCRVCNSSVFMEDGSCYGCFLSREKSGLNYLQKCGWKITSAPTGGFWAYDTQSGHCGSGLVYGALTIAELRGKIERLAVPKPTGFKDETEAREWLKTYSKNHYGEWSLKYEKDSQGLTIYTVWFWIPRGHVSYTDVRSATSHIGISDAISLLRNQLEPIREQ